MAYFEPAVITRAGVNLIANDIAGIGNIEFVKMVSGAGEYTEEEKTKNALAERTALKDQRQEFVFNAIEVKSEKSVLLKSVISNQTLEEGYRITEVGIYAREKGTEGEGSLYSISLAIEADFLPPFNGLNPSEIVQEYYATVSDAATVSIVSAPGALALYEDLKTLERVLENKMNELNCIISNPDNMYNENSTYILGEYCVYNGQIYICVAPIEEPEGWNEEHWEKTTITKELFALNNKEVEVVDPMTATEEGFAADAKLTGDALKELNANFQGAADAIGDAISGLGFDVPEGTTLLEMADIITNHMLVKTARSTIRVAGGSISGSITSVIPLTQVTISGSAFSKEGNVVKMVYDVTVTILASVPLVASAKGYVSYVYLRKNGANVRSGNVSGAHSSSTTSGTVSLTYSGAAKAGDYFDLVYKGDHSWSSTSGSVIDFVGTT